MTAHAVGITLVKVARENVEKLRAWYPEGYSDGRSRERGAE